MIPFFGSARNARGRHAAPESNAAPDWRRALLRRPTAAWFALLALLAAAPASASHVTVRPDGTGDFPTLNDAVQAMSWAYIADTIMVEPGYYDETVNDANYFGFVIFARAGAESTHVRGFTSLPESPRYSGWGYGRAVGLTIDTRVAWGNNTEMLYWEHCIFAGGFDGKAPDGQSAPIHGCTFRDTSSFVGFGYTMSDCTFERAPIYVENVLGYFELLRCTFRGPALQIARVTPRDNSEIVFQDCTFSDATDGIVVTPRSYWYQLVAVQNCRFDRFEGAVMRFEYGDWLQPESGRLALGVADCRITDVGQFLRCRTSIPISLGLGADTVTTTRGIAIESTVERGGVGGLQLIDARGGGLHLRALNFNPEFHPSDGLEQFTVTGVRITGSGGDGIVIEQRLDPVRVMHEVTVSGTVVERSAGVGLRATAARLTVRGCLLRENAGDGLHVTPVGPAPACSLAYNTVVGNAGRGLVLETPSSVAPLSVDHNLVTGNDLDGLSVLTTYVGRVERNDSWANGGAAYRGPMSLDTNLQLDPLYCMASAGDFELRAGSPCAPTGAYGTIGAYGVGCAAPTAVEPAAAPAAFRIAPNPARSAVEFAWSPLMRLIELAIYDVQGRRCGRAPAGAIAAGAFRWDGRGPAGERLPAGVYLVRWRDATSGGSARVVLLGD